MTIKPVILITGASSGIGWASALLFARRGYRVALAARSQAKLEALVEEIRSQGGEALAVRTDIIRLEDIQHLVERTLSEYGQIDVLMNNAGIGSLDWLEKLDPEKAVQAMLETNLLGLIWMAQAVLPHMIGRGEGHIINMASFAGLIATPTYSIYAASKFGVRGFTDALRREVSLKGIKVSGIYPGGVGTGFARSDVARRKTGMHTPGWLALSAEQVAQAAYDLTRHPRRMLVIPWILHIAYWISLLFPGLVDYVVETFFVRPERQGENSME